ncbi:MAG: hypothetical protein ABIH42_03375 [Planctomycetota bacterium]
MGRKNYNNETIHFANAAASPANAGELQRNGAALEFNDGTAARNIVKAEAAPSIIPALDDTYYLGEVSSPYKAWKAVILKDTTDGKHYKIECVNGVLTATALD